MGLPFRGNEAGQVFAPEVNKGSKHWPDQMNPWLIGFI